MFNLNNKVIYPGHGVAVIDDIIEKRVAGNSIKFFKLNFMFKDMTILIPMHSLKHTGMRPLSDKECIDGVLNELYKEPSKKLEYLDFTPSGWNRRNKDYQLKIQSGKLFDIAQIYRDLMYIAQQKELSFGEKNLLQTAEELLIQEIQVVTEQSRDLVLQELQNPFKQLYFQGHTEQVSAA
jgi:CarD family transcriptional regulator